MRAGRAHGTARLLITLVALMRMPAAVAGPVASAAPGELLPLPNQPRSLQAELLETIARPTSVASYGGWAAWSRYDAPRRAYQLVVRNMKGSVAAMAVPESPQPFEVSLGPLASGAVGAVYTRCANAVEHVGCRLEQLAIESTGAREQRLPLVVGRSFDLRCRNARSRFCAPCQRVAKAIRWKCSSGPPVRSA
jgi:hypothetical protein